MSRHRLDRRESHGPTEAGASRSQRGGAVAMRGPRSTVFRVALVGSIAAHVVALVFHVSTSEASVTREVRIPVVLEEPEPPPPPPPPPEETPPKKQRQVAPRPAPPPPKPIVSDEPAVLDEPTEVAEGAGDGPVGAPVAQPEAPEPKLEAKPKRKKTLSREAKVKLTRGYFSQIRGAVDARKQYPFKARRMGVTGSVRISFTIGADGNFSGISVKRSSGHSVLDNAAVSTVRAVSGSVQRPNRLGSTPLRMTVLVHYELDT